MRYLDWDVLLFPSGEEGANVPVKEFQTACYVEQQDNTITPLLTCFVPTLPRDSPFQISVHSWTKTAPMMAVEPRSVRPTELWQAKVVIDGNCVTTENFAIDASWPQIITSTTAPGDGRERHQLTFPPFHRGLTSQSHWDASDRVGRIRVELAAGYVDERNGHFVKLLNAITFAFQPAPMELLEQNGVAWPNQRMLMNPLLNNAVPNGGARTTYHHKHKKIASVNNVITSMPMNGHSFPPAPYVQDLHSNYDGSSRSSSAYSLFPESAAPLLTRTPLLPATYPGIQSNVVRNNQPIKFRLPTDQLEIIVNALHSQGYQQHTANSTTTMPPPPLPAHVTTTKVEGLTDHRQTVVNPASDPPLGSDIFSFIDRRGESRYSDVSMHAGCTSFPSCTSEDAEGHIVHNPPQAPSTVVRGRKEGSSPTKPRDFFSTILDTSAPPQTSATITAAQTQAPPGEIPTSLLSSSPADAQGKKRTRSALKSLNLNDASPEKKTTTKPPRKASRASTSSSKSTKKTLSDDQENQESMVLDA